MAKYKPWGQELSVLTAYTPYMVIETEYFLYPVSWYIYDVVSVISTPPFIDTLMPSISCKVCVKLLYWSYEATSNV